MTRRFYLAYLPIGLALLVLSVAQPTPYHPLLLLVGVALVAVVLVDYFESTRHSDRPHR